MAQNLSIGLFGIGLDTYWAQFDGLKERLEGYQRQIAGRLACEDCRLVDAGLVDSVEKASQAGNAFAQAEVELVFLYISTYALSSTVLPVVQHLPAPVVALNLQPARRIDYAAFNRLPSREAMTGEWLAHCQACSAPEIASAFKRTGRPFHLVTGTLDDPQAWEEIQTWVKAAQAAHSLRNTTVGLLGLYYGGMLDVYSDFTQLAGAFGCHFDLLEMDELHALRQAVGPAEVEAMLAEFGRQFAVSAECSAFELERAARTSAALQRLVAKHGLGALAYYYEGQPGSAHEDIDTSVIAGNTLLTANHVPVAGEYEVKNVLAMKIMDSLGCGGSFSELYALDFDDDVVLLGHDGPAHAAIAEGKVGLVPLQVYHGKPGKGLSIQMTVRQGPATLLSVCQEGDGRVKLLTAEAEVVPGATLQIGNTNSRYRFSIGAKEFINRWSQAGPSHHCAIGLGRQAAAIEKLGAILGLQVERVC